MRCPGASPRPGRTSRAAAMSVAVAGRGRGRLPDLDDLLGDPGAAQAARARGRVGAALHLPALRRRAPAPGRRQGRRPLRHGDDREAGRLGRARQHDGRRAAERRRARAPSTSSPATSGSSRPRCATRSSSSPRPRAGSPASSCRASPRTASATRSRSSASRTSSATARTPPARSSSAAPGRGWSARRAAACRRSSRWSTTPASTARSARPPGCARRSRTRSTTPRSGPRSAGCLIDQPLMRNVLADLALESEAATIGALRLARAYDESIAGDERATQFKRIANAVLKYWLCKRAVPHAGEALECLGGNGYVEESGMPRLYRESPLNSIWEGSGNVQCLDVLRAMARGPAGAGGVLRRGRRGRRGRPAPRRRGGVPARRARRPRGDRDPRPPRGRADGAGAAGLARWSASATRPSPTPSAPRGSAATGAARSAPCRPAPTSSRIIERHTPTPEAAARCQAAVGAAHLRLAHGCARSADPVSHPGDPDRGRLLLVLRPLPDHLVALGLLPRRARRVEQSDSEPYLLAVASALAFFGSILLHELGHAVVANRRGIPITEITLWLFGGVARMTQGHRLARDRVQDRRRGAGGDPGPGGALRRDRDRDRRARRVLGRDAGRLRTPASRACWRWSPGWRASTCSCSSST